MAARPHPAGADAAASGWKQGATLLAMGVGVAIVGLLVAQGLRAWTAYDERSGREALDEAMAPGLPAWTALEREHGFSSAAPVQRDPEGSPGPDAEGRGHWLEVVTHGRRPNPSLPERGVILTLSGEGHVVLSEAHRALPDRLRATSADEVGWVVFTRLARVEHAYYFEEHPAAIERLETRLIGVDGTRLARAAAEALPPSFIAREPPRPTAFRLPTELTVRLTRRMVDAARAARPEADADEGALSIAP